MPLRQTTINESLQPSLALVQASLIQSRSSHTLFSLTSTVTAVMKTEDLVDFYQIRQTGQAACAA
jgi:hypothetical protein